MRDMVRILFIAACAIAALVFAQTGRAEDSCKQAIERGAKYLIDLHKPAESYAGGSHGVGSASLVGLALLESNIATDNAALKNITAYVRARALSQTKTYEASLAIMFLDRLGKSIDRPAIQFLAIRLMAGQDVRSGGWSYDIGYELSDAETARVRKAIYEETRLRTNEKLNDESDPGREKPQDARIGLHPEAIRFARWIAANPNEIDNSGDNSNTQFGVLALWIARKHGVQCDRALAAAEKRFRNSQTRDGAWTYMFPNGLALDDLTNMPATTASATMTCSGLLALATGRGIQIAALRSKLSGQGVGSGSGASTNDRQIMAALKYLENAIAKSERPAQPKENPNSNSDTGKLCGNLYFLWSLERVAMIYNLDRIGNLDWYKWGADHLIKTQKENGSWDQSGYEGANAEINSAFALLFLNRANLASDLTATLKSTAKINLPDRKTDPETIKVDPKQSGDPDAEATRLANELIKAAAATRPTILAKLRDTKGSVYTEALVRAIAKLQGEPQGQAREALAMRLKRMTAATLRDMLKDENGEIRNAAARACGLKDDKQFISDLIKALSDAESFVVQSARASLRSLSGKDFGPQSDASAADKAKAIADWKAWLATQSK